MKTLQEIKKIENEKLFHGAFRFNTKALGLGLGLVFGLAIFIGTNWLLIKGGEVVGPHLALISQFFIGYRVSFFGSLIGFGYGFALGTLSGALIGKIYTMIVRLRDHYGF